MSSTGTPAPVAQAEAKVVADEKTVETALKQPAKVNWLFVAAVGVVANLIGVLLHV